MASEIGGPQLDDPLGGYSLLSLLPKTLGPRAASWDAESAASEAQELETLENLFKSKAGNPSPELVQQAQTIMKSYQNIDNLYPQDGSFANDCEMRPPERRPALGRKRARFSLKPTASHPEPSIDLHSSIDHIDDPEEYFIVFEQLQNAEKELKKLRGDVPTDSIQQLQSPTTRKRRPGLLGKTTSYKHHSSANFVSENFGESQEEHHKGRIPSSSRTSVDLGPYNLFEMELLERPSSSQAKDANNAPQDATESQDSVTDKENKVGDLLGKLLSSFNDFDGDEGKDFLRESLQMKSIDTWKIRLPELGNTQLSQCGAFIKGTTHGELRSSQTSSPSIRSPLGILSTLKRRFSLKDPLIDAYSELPGDDAPSTGGSSLGKSTRRRSVSVKDVGSHGDGASPLVENGTRLVFKDNICSAVAEPDRSVGKNIIGDEKLSDDQLPLLQKITNNEDSVFVVNGKSNISDDSVGALPEGNDLQLDPIVDNHPDAGGQTLCYNDRQRTPEISNQPSQSSRQHLDPVITNQLDAGGQSFGYNDQQRTTEISDQSSQSARQHDDTEKQDLLITNQPDTAASEVLTPSSRQTRRKKSATPPNIKTNRNRRNAETNVETGLPGPDGTHLPEVGTSINEKVSDAQSSKGTSCSPRAITATNQNAKNVRALPEENNQVNQPTSKSPRSELRRKKVPPGTGNKKKSASRRQSLGGAGTKWEDGRRKSTRRKFRPLEHWRGERLLYGRIHESLATVIGVKYASPGKDALKVESCVPEEFADLVAQVAR